MKGVFTVILLIMLTWRQLSISYSKQLFEKFLKFQRDMTHLIVHLVKINEARFLFDDIFSICTSSYVFSHEANEALSATLALLLPSLFSLCSKGKSQAFSCLMQLPFILQLTWSFLLDELLRYAKHKKSLSFEAFLREKVGGSLPKMKCHIENQRWTKFESFVECLGRNLSLRLGRMLS